MWADRNEDKLTKPLEGHSFSGHFVFSYGHLLINAGYDCGVDRNFVFFGEEPY